MLNVRSAALALAALTLGCHERRPEPPITAPAPQASAQPAPAAKVKPAPASTEVQPPQPKAEEYPPAEEGCAVAAHGGTSQPVQIGTLNGGLEGTTLTLPDPHADGKLVLGVLGPINESSGENLLALQKYQAFFTQNHADAIVVTGDVGEVGSGIERAVSELAQSGLPVLVVIGNRECRADFNDGVRGAQKSHSNVVNLDEIREVRFPEATLVSLPGYHDPNYINCDTGCRYTKGTLHDVLQLAQDAKTPVVLVSHGPPHGEGSQAIDYAESGGNVGDPQINSVIDQAHIAFGLFSNIKEAGGRATDLAGTTRVPQDTFVSSLYLNPGPAGAEGWRMNDGTTGHGYAALLTLQDGKGAWKLYQGKNLTPAERKRARALEDGDATQAPRTHPGKKKK